MTENKNSLPDLMSVLQKNSQMQAHTHTHDHTACAGHFCQFYRSERFLAAALAEYIRIGINNKEGVVVLATHTHIKMVKEELSLMLPNYEQYIDNKQLKFCDADMALEMVMTENRPDFSKFKSLVTRVIEMMTVEHKAVRFYGELVNLLCEKGRHQDSLQLEGFWNIVLKDYNNVILMCGYSTEHLENGHVKNDFLPISEIHSNTIYPEHFVENKTKDAFFRKMAAMEIRSTLLNITGQKRCSCHDNK